MTPGLVDHELVGLLQEVFLSLFISLVISVEVESAYLVGSLNSVAFGGLMYCISSCRASNSLFKSVWPPLPLAVLGMVLLDDCYCYSPLLLVALSNNHLSLNISMEGLLSADLS